MAATGMQAIRCWNIARHHGLAIQRMRSIGSSVRRRYWEYYDAAVVEAKIHRAGDQYDDAAVATALAAATAGLEGATIRLVVAVVVTADSCEQFAT